MRVTPTSAVRAFKRFIYSPRTPGRRAEQRIVRRFHRLYYNVRQRTWANTFWLSVPVGKCPLDLWIYQEIICETKPDVIIETGTGQGGSALFLSSVCDLVNHGRIITIDIEARANRPEHHRIKYLEGSSTAPEIVEEVKGLIKPDERVMVILDSDHSAAHVLLELKTYGPLVTVGNYLIVEDTNVNGHPVLPLYGAGPMEALEEFARTQRDFIEDREREKFFMTFNPKGYLRRFS